MFERAAGPFQKLYPQRVRIRQSSANEKRRHYRIDAPFGHFARLPRRVADQAIVGFHADQHGIAFDDAAPAPVVGKLQWRGEGVGQQMSCDGADPHPVRL